MGDKSRGAFEWTTRGCATTEIPVVDSTIHYEFGSRRGVRPLTSLDDEAGISGGGMAPAAAAAAVAAAWLSCGSPIGGDE